MHEAFQKIIDALEEEKELVGEDLDYYGTALDFAKNTVLQIAAEYDDRLVKAKTEISLWERICNRLQLLGCVCDNSHCDGENLFTGNHSFHISAPQSGRGMIDWSFGHTEVSVIYHTYEEFEKELQTFLDFIKEATLETEKPKPEHTSTPSFMDWNIPEIMRGYEERNVIQSSNLLVIKYVNAYQLSKYSGFLCSTANAVIRAYYAAKEKGKDPKFIVTLSASEVKALLSEVETALCEQCERLSQEREQQETEEEMER